MIDIQLMGWIGTDVVWGVTLDHISLLKTSMITVRVCIQSK